MYLMKAGTSVDAAIRDVSELTRHELSDADLVGTLFVKTNPSGVPWWVDFLNPLSVDDIRVSSVRTTSAVLALRLASRGRNARTVCFTFGHGRHLLDPSRVDRSFGLRVALNAVDPVKLRGFDTRRQDDVVVNSRIQSSVGTDLAAFDLDTYRDILTKAAGATLESLRGDLGILVRGSDGVSFDVQIAPEDLADRARRLLSVFRRNDYSRAFPFVDHIVAVDPMLADDLDVKLSAELREQMSGGDSTFECLYLAAPEVLDLERLEGFVFSSEMGSKKTVRSELCLSDYLDTRRGRSAGIDVAMAKRDRIDLRYEGEVEYRLGTVYRCLIAEVDLGDAIYQLVDGRWYEIESSFVAKIRGIVSGIPEATLDFPDHIDGQSEKEYNLRAAEALDALLMDCENVSIGGGASRIEFCDIALLNRTLVHAKKRSSSSTLSHLWSQGTVAMEALLGDDEFRSAVRSKIKGLDRGYEGIAADGLTGSDYKVVYLIIGSNPEQQAWESLPFFSQVALRQAVRALASMGVHTSIAGVPSVK